MDVVDLIHVAASDWGLFCNAANDNDPDLVTGPSQLKLVCSKRDC
jgi:hypothetical protein